MDQSFLIVRPVLHEPRPGLPDQDVVGGGEEDGGPDGGHQQPVVTPLVPQSVYGVEELGDLSLVSGGGGPRPVVHPDY